MPPIQITPMDYDVSGCVVYAFSEDSAKQLCERFADGRATMQYDCVVNGPLLETTGEIEADVPTAGDEAVICDRLRTGGIETPRTTWRAIDTFVAFARIECTPNIPSDLQIRVHLQHASIPLAVDKQHGGATQLMLSSFKAGYRKSRRHDERPLIQRPSLHAKSVAFEHPTSNEKLTIEAEHGKDYRALLHQLDRFGRVPK
jgi:23S rRNA-/tRNA-specific pseudouridylate synthase